MTLMPMRKKTTMKTMTNPKTVKTTKEQESTENNDDEQQAEESTNDNASNNEDEDDEATVVESNDGSDDEEGGRLPDTATSTFNWLLVGGASLAAGGLGVFLTRKKK